MSIARREAKWMIVSLRCAGQVSSPLQRHTASPSSRTISEPQTGHWVGIRHGTVPSGRRSATTPTTSGITSPARRTITVSPLRTSSRATWSALCRVARVTVTPPTCTGCISAHGVTAPVRPTLTSIDSSTVICSCAGNLCAIAQRGARETKPISRCPSPSSSL